MKTTNILLGIIAILLFLNLSNLSLSNFISQANAQTDSPQTKKKDEVINVRIVSIDGNAIMTILPKKDYKNEYEIFPVYVMNGQPTGILKQPYGDPVKVHHTNR